MPPSPALQDVLTRARTDPRFRQQLEAEPLQALADYPLSPDERYALIQRDRALLEQLGVADDWADWFGVQH